MELPAGRCTPAQLVERTKQGRAGKSASRDPRIFAGVSFYASVSDAMRCKLDAGKHRRVVTQSRAGKATLIAFIGSQSGAAIGGAGHFWPARADVLLSRQSFPFAASRSGTFPLSLRHPFGQASETPNEACDKPTVVVGKGAGQ